MTTIWAIFDWLSEGDMEVKLRVQETHSAFIATDPRLLVRTGAVEPELGAWPPLTQQWQLFCSLQMP